MSGSERIFRGVTRLVFMSLAALLISRAQYELDPWWSFFMCFGALGCLGFGGVFQIGMMED